MLPAGEVRIYLACGVTDMRKGFHSLAAQVQTALNHDPYSGALHVFRGRRGDLIKILFFGFLAVHLNDQISTIQSGF